MSEQPAKLHWPPDYVGEVRRRIRLWEAFKDPQIAAGAWLKYKADPVAFVADLVWIYEPRNANRGLPTKLPAVPFPRQAEFIWWLYERFATGTSGGCDKSRDSGASWMACAFAVWVWVFHPGAAVGLGSRKEVLVDRKGDPGSLFEKVRIIIANLPPCFMPKGWDADEHSNYMRILNPQNGAAIVGEAGDNIGRGGRTAMYVVDETSFLANPFMVAAALSANTDCRIDISTPLPGSHFTESFPTIKHPFTFDATDAPWHTPEWLAAKRAELEAAGLGHLYAQEFLRDTQAGVEGQLIPGAWVQAAIEAADAVGAVASGVKGTSLDPADGGRDQSAVAHRHGFLLVDVLSRGDCRADEAGRWALGLSREFGAAELRVDATGIGAGSVSAIRAGGNGPKLIEWHAAGAVVTPHERYAGDRKHVDAFSNAKAQGWWLLRDRFLATYKAMQEGDWSDPDSMIAISPRCRELRALRSELAQVRYSYDKAGKIKIDKAPDGQKSPNLADALMLGFAPRPATGVMVGRLSFGR